MLFSGMDILTERREANIYNSNSTHILIFLFVSSVSVVCVCVLFFVVILYVRVQKFVPDLKFNDISPKYNVAVVCGSKFILIVAVWQALFSDSTPNTSFNL